MKKYFKIFIFSFLFAILIIDNTCVFAESKNYSWYSNSNIMVSFTANLGNENMLYCPYFIILTCYSPTNTGQWGRTLYCSDVPFSLRCCYDNEYFQEGNNSTRYYYNYWFDFGDTCPQYFSSLSIANDSSNTTSQTYEIDNHGYLYDSRNISNFNCILCDFSLSLN